VKWKSEAVRVVFGFQPPPALPSKVSRPNAPLFAGPRSLSSPWARVQRQRFGFGCSQVCCTVQLSAVLSQLWPIRHDLCLARALIEPIRTPGQVGQCAQVPPPFPNLDAVLSRDSRTARPMYLKFRSPRPSELFPFHEISSWTPWLLSLRESSILFLVKKDTLSVELCSLCSRTGTHGKNFVLKELSSFGRSAPRSRHPHHAGASRV
jgi:hypothetical protein